MKQIQEFLSNIRNTFPSITVVDILDILLVAFVIYQVINLIRSTSAYRIAKAIVILLIVTAVTDLLNFHTINYLLERVLELGFVALVIVFQPELRSFLEHMGRSKFNVGSLFGEEDDPHEAQLNAINGVVDAFRTLQKQKMGALVVFEQEDLLNDIAATGTQVDALPNSGVISNIFFNKAPLHDGAVIIRDGRVHAAGCILPLTKSTNISMELGTRHRAAIGMSENSDAVVVVLSEETGQLSIAVAGKLSRFDTATEFTSELMQVLLPSRNEQQTPGKKIPFISGVRKKLIRKAKNDETESEKQSDAPVELHEQPENKN